MASPCLLEKVYVALEERSIEGDHFGIRIIPERHVATEHSLVREHPVTIRKLVQHIEFIEEALIGDIKVIVVVAAAVPASDALKNRPRGVFPFIG